MACAGTEVRAFFEKTHQAQFSQGESLVDYMARRNGGAKAAAASPKPATSATSSVVSPTSAAKRKREPEAAEPTPKRAAVPEVGFLAPACPFFLGSLS